MNNVVVLKAVRELKKASEDELSYEARILAMDKVQLLEEMMAFQSERSKSEKLSLKLMIQGRVLFRALEQRAETEELRILAKTYRRHLKFELEAYHKASGVRSHETAV